MPDSPALWSLEGQVAVVTGAGSERGIGFASARALGDAGADVVIASTTERIHQRADELSGGGVASLGVVGDLTRPEDADRLIATAIGWRGRLDIVVNNAGMVSVAAGHDEDRPLERQTHDEWSDSLARNLTTAFLVCRAAVPAMRSGGYGRIVNMSSVTGPLVAIPGYAPYAAGKAGYGGGGTRYHRERRGSRMDRHRLIGRVGDRGRRGDTSRPCRDAGRGRGCRGVSGVARGVLRHRPGLRGRRRQLHRR
jgi:3-oxoacyl-[acyl-carrier protein] reductase